MQRECDWLSNNTEIMHVQFMKKLVHQIDAIFTLTRTGRVDISVIGDNIEINKKILSKMYREAHLENLNINKPYFPKLLYINKGPCNTYQFIG